MSVADRSLRVAMISTDFGFRDQVRDLLRSPDLGFSLELETAEPLAAYGEDQVEALRRLEPDLVLLDFESDVDLGIRFAKFLADSTLECRILGVGPSLDAGRLLLAIRAGAIDYLEKPVAPAALTEALGRVAQTFGRAAAKPKRSGEIYSVFGPKGGAGVTSIATNFAIALHRLTGRRTLLVDMDLELGEVALFLGMQPKFNFIDMVQNFHRMDADLLASYIEQHESGVHLLSAPFHPERIESVSAEEIRRILYFLRQHYDYVVVDTPKSFAPLTLATFDQSDLVFVVTTVDLPSLRNIQRGLPMLRRVLPGGDDQIRLIVNRYNVSNDLSLDDVQQSLGLKVFATIGNDYDVVMSSINTGKPVVVSGPSSYTRDLRVLTSRVVGLNGSGDEERRRSGGWMSRVLSTLGRRQNGATS